MHPRKGERRRRMAACSAFSCSIAFAADGSMVYSRISMMPCMGEHAQSAGIRLYLLPSAA